MFSVDIRNIFTFPDISPALGRVNVANFSKDKCPGIHFHFLLKITLIHKYLILPCPGYYIFASDYDDNVYLFMKKIFVFAAIISMIAASVPALHAQKTSKVSGREHLPKNIILMIGDGMGLPQMYAAYTASCGSLHMAEFNQIALVKTLSASDYITDSGAGGTALACGIKTNNGMIGMGPDSIPVKSILKIAEDKGLSTGIVVTCDVTHATPASFIATVKSRKQAEDIAMQFLSTDIDVFIGGGRDAFANRRDSLNLLDSLAKHNYTVASTIPAMLNVNQGKLAALLYPGHPPKFSEGRGDMLSLSTEKALELLSKNQKGFFMMIEGSQIDWGGHDNDLDYVVNETLDFDKAVGIALEFARKNGETLVIVTADHETGGLSNMEGNFETGQTGGRFTTDDHSGVPVPLYAFGPGSGNFKGLMDNTDVFRLMLQLLNLSR
jgi:alkaline phosphatase